VLARVYVNGKLTRSYRGRSLRKIAFARPAPRRFKLRIVSKLSDGEQWLITVSYNGCSHSKPKLTHLAHE